MTALSDLRSRATPMATAWLRQLLARTARLTAKLIALALAIAAGAVSSWYAVNSGLPFNTEVSGPWVHWTHAGDAAAEPYTRARFASVGTLLVNAERVVRLEARVDDDGRRLHSSCTYRIDSAPLAAAWWTLSVFDAEGRLIANGAQRYGFNRATVARDPAGHFSIVLSRDASPGNWLPTGSAGRMTILLDLLESGADERSETDAAPLPSIRRVAC